MERIKGGGAWNGGGKSGNGLGPDKSQEEGQGGRWGVDGGGRGQEVLKGGQAAPDRSLQKEDLEDGWKMETVAVLPNTECTCWHDRPMQGHCRGLIIQSTEKPRFFSWGSSFF
ncbi:hypothetical protein D4764_06G0012270 [Takifugu flavidus]|uniref:Uncharacterized protein n=1 Tax=Takifugu flavidus TaxID=433684 RepID=A0A5C6N204_9TELE|nr:hypothetical protein D4764_06G0012270 [Takifugu flavidus]